MLPSGEMGLTRQDNDGNSLRGVGPAPPAMIDLTYHEADSKFGCALTRMASNARPELGSFAR